MILTGEYWRTRRQVWVPLCPPQISHGLAWGQTRWLTAWAMAHPSNSVSHIKALMPVSDTCRQNSRYACWCTDSECFATFAILWRREQRAKKVVTRDSEVLVAILVVWHVFVFPVFIKNACFKLFLAHSIKTECRNMKVRRCENECL